MISLHIRISHDLNSFVQVSVFFILWIQVQACGKSSVPIYSLKLTQGRVANHLADGIESIAGVHRGHLEVSEAPVINGLSRRSIPEAKIGPQMVEESRVWSFSESMEGMDSCPGVQVGHLGDEFSLLSSSFKL